MPTDPNVLVSQLTVARHILIEQLLEAEREIARLREARPQPSGERHGWTLWDHVQCVECPGCGFTFDADHEDTEGGGYSCPVCNA